MNTDITNINYSLELLERDKSDRGHIINELLRIKEKFHIQKCNILEVGCGLGQNLSIFQADNSVKGIEGLPDVVRVANSLGLDVTQSDLEQPLVNLANASQDWILCLDVLEHLVNPLNLMLEIHRILKQDGKAIINVPNHFTWRGRLKILMGSGLDVHNFFPDSDDWNNPHIRFFTFSGYRRLIEKSGFEVIDNRCSLLPTVPLAKYFNRLGLHQLMNNLARKQPSLFAASFCVVLQKI
ncbi:methylase involved in ubiquinone/menaquinone biosynthesis [Calothrix brevissima NIES-22]|nr:methylase involved in ubiquinone/menaquinone biosynthesis [Calothrix brevissima NIES-22]